MTSRGLLAALVAALLAVLLGGGLGAPAAAHTRLVSSTPAEGATVPASPAELALTFSQPVLDLGATAVVSDAGGARPPVTPRVEGTRVVADLPDGLAGPVRVAWRVTASDGHPISGEVAFEVAPEPAEPTTGPTEQPPAATAEPEPGQGTVATTAPAATGTAAAPGAGGSADAGQDGGGQGGGLPVGWLLAGTLGVVVLGGAGVLVARRAGGAPSP